MPITTSLCERKSLDSRPVDVIIRFTDGYAQRRTCQTLNPAAARDAEPAAGGCDARELSQYRLLRPAGLAAGQVRNAPLRRHRQGADQPGGKGLRILAAIVLSGTICVSAGWTCRPPSAQTWTSRWTQADSGTDDIRRATPYCRSRHLRFSAGRSH